LGVSHLRQDRGGAPYQRGSEEEKETMGHVLKIWVRIK
jgi:hypothetical protein